MQPSSQCATHSAKMRIGQTVSQTCMVEVSSYHVLRLLWAPVSISALYSNQELYPFVIDRDTLAIGMTLTSAWRLASKGWWLLVYVNISIPLSLPVSSAAWMKMHIRWCNKHLTEMSESYRLSIAGVCRSNYPTQYGSQRGMPDETADFKRFTWTQWKWFSSC